MHLAAYLGCGGIVNSHTEKDLLLSLLVKEIKIGKDLT